MARSSNSSNPIATSPTSPTTERYYKKRSRSHLRSISSFKPIIQPRRKSYSYASKRRATILATVIPTINTCGDCCLCIEVYTKSSSSLGGIMPVVPKAEKTGICTECCGILRPYTVRAIGKPMTHYYCGHKGDTHAVLRLQKSADSKQGGLLQDRCLEQNPLLPPKVQA